MREESAHNPILGPLYKSVQAIFVKRTTKESRKQVVEEIVHRGTTPGYPYLLIFPEGTTTNGEAVVTFKNGAFIPGKPVQPIVLRYPNSHYDPHWTPEIAEANLFYRFLSQFVNHAEIEVLEPYTPNEEEKKNPTLYASNVQKYMAKHLGVPATTHSFQDALLLTTASKIYKRNFELNFTIHDMIQQYGLKFEKEQNDFEDLLKMFSNIDKNRDGKIDYEEFKETIIELSKLTESSQDKLQKDEYIKVLFKLMVKE
jgi:lysophosphatidylcholine acyltransferase / lyso-PAF acetyltransferase